MTPYLIFIVFAVTLYVVNELCRRNYWAVIVIFVILPTILLIFGPWLDNARAPGSLTGNWFVWAKLYSVLFAAVIFTWFRYKKGQFKTRLWVLLPVIILAVNIMEAVVRDWELGNEFGGSWHYMNAIAGFLNILAISGWSKIYISGDKFKDMVWRDQGVLWIIAYDIWNIAFCYNLDQTQISYIFVLLIVPTICSVFIAPGTWIQARAYTLGIWMMWWLTFTPSIKDPAYTPIYFVSDNFLFWLSAISLVANIALVGYYVMRMKTLNNYNPADEHYVDPDSPLERA